MTKPKPSSVDERHAALERALDKLEAVAKNWRKGTFSFRLLEAKELWDYIELLRVESCGECCREAVAAKAVKVAEHYETQVGDVKQVRIVPEPQLSKLKAKHWRILGDWLRQYH